MKRTVLFISLLFPLSLIYCQSNYQIADTIKKWNNLACGYTLIVCACHTHTIRFLGDTVIDSKDYLKVLESIDSLPQNWNVVGFIHEDSLSHEVYFRNLNNEEGMIYDFSLSINDTVIIFNTYMGFPYAVPLICYQIDSITINNNFRTRYFLSWAYRPFPEEDDIWIEGIGSLYGIFNSAYTVTGFCGGFRELLCYSENDSLIYMNPPFYQCYMDEFYPKILDESYDTAFVGVSYEFPISSTDTNANDSVTWASHIMPQNFWLDTVNGIIHGNPVTPGNFRCWVFVKNWGYQVDWLDTNIVVTYPLSITSPKKTKVKIFPNPTDGLVNVEIYPLSEKILRLYSSYGKLLFESMSDRPTTSVDLSKFPSGLYCLSIYDKIKNSNDYQVIVKY